MATRVVIGFVLSEYAPFTGGAIAFPLTEREAAFIQTLLPIMLNRDAWAEISDADWETLQSEIYAIMELLQ